MDKVFRLEARARMTANKQGEVTIYSAIYPYRWGEDDPTVTSNDFIKALDEMDADEITVRINSPGGVVSEAVAIRTALMKHRAKKTIDIEGCCDSAATLIACMPGAQVRMAKGGEYMIHQCSGGVWGNQDALRSALESAEKTDRSMAEIYSERTGKSVDECLALMKKESWFTAEEAKENGFVDEIIGENDGDVQFVACAVTAEQDQLMRSWYANVPSHRIAESLGGFPVAPQAPFGASTSFEGDASRTAENGPGIDSLPSAGASGTEGEEGEGESQTAQEGPKNGSNAQTAVAAGNASVNTTKGDTGMDELKTATADQLKEANPNLVAEIANAAIAAERGRIARIDKLTPKGAKFAELAKTAKAEGMSVEDYLEKVIELQAQAGEEYMEARKAETAPAAQIGAGDSKDNDGDLTAKIDKAAKEIAELAGGMTVNVTEMA